MNNPRGLSQLDYRSLVISKKEIIKKANTTRRLHSRSRQRKITPALLHNSSIMHVLEKHSASTEQAPAPEEPTVESIVESKPHGSFRNPDPTWVCTSSGCASLSSLRGRSSIGTDRLGRLAKAGVAASGYGYVSSGGADRRARHPVPALPMEATA